MKQNTEIQADLASTGYIADKSLVMAIKMMNILKRPLLLEGDAGVGKTHLAKSIAQATKSELLRLQCYEGLDSASAIYEWNYQKQLLSAKLLEDSDLDTKQKQDHIFSEEFLLQRPLLKAIQSTEQSVLLIDEIDRADEEFEAFLLEVLSDYEISIPELGTVKAKSIPIVILTSNGTRELSDALRRRCLFHYLDYPDETTEIRILQSHIKEIDINLASQIVRFVQKLRLEDIEKKPGIAETIDWAGVLLGLEVTDLKQDSEQLYQTLCCLLKTKVDRSQYPVAIVEKFVGKVA